MLDGRVARILYGVARGGDRDNYMACARPIYYASRMRLLMLLLLLLASSLAAAESARDYPLWPLWDGVESVADYAKRANLPAMKTLELGDNVKLELVLIPAGKFVMGTPSPTPVDEAGFNRKIVTGIACLAASGGALGILLGFVLVQGIRGRRRPQVSLGLLLLVTLATGGCAERVALAAIDGWATGGAVRICGCGSAFQMCIQEREAGAPGVAGSAVLHGEIRCDAGAISAIDRDESQQVQG